MFVTIIIITINTLENGIYSIVMLLLKDNWEQYYTFHLFYMTLYGIITNIILISISIGLIYTSYKIIQDFNSNYYMSLKENKKEIKNEEMEEMKVNESDENIIVESESENEEGSVEIKEKVENDKKESKTEIEKKSKMVKLLFKKVFLCVKYNVDCIDNNCFSINNHTICDIANIEVF
jgi:preprotein translocase subunit SecF